MMHIQDPVKHLYWSFFCENNSQYGPKYVSGIPLVSFAKPKKTDVFYTDTLATNILQKWSMLRNKTNEDFYLLENERKINRKVNAVYSIKFIKTLSRFVWCGENKKN